jgi:hypothetical protein
LLRAAGGGFGGSGLAKSIRRRFLWITLAESSRRRFW